jgi:hypothetical protein
VNGWQNMTEKFVTLELGIEFRSKKVDAAIAKFWREFLLVSIAAILSIQTADKAICAEKPTAPNIILILADDK